MVKRRRRPFLPEEIVETHKRIAQQFGFNTSPPGFQIMHKLMKGEAKITRKKKPGKGNKYVWEMELDDL